MLYTLLISSELFDGITAVPSLFAVDTADLWEICRLRDCKTKHMQLVHNNQMLMKLHSLSFSADELTETDFSSCSLPVCKYGSIASIGQSIQEAIVLRTPRG